jgi:AraC family transcriptional regulator
MQSTCASADFYGDIRRKQLIGGFMLTESVYRPGEEIPRHSHRCAYFCLVLGGAFTESYGASSREYGARTLVFHPEGEVHADRFHGAGGRVFSVAVPPSWAARLRDLMPPLDRRACVRGDMAPWLATRLYREFQEPDMLSPLVTEGLILEILGHGAREASRGRSNAPPRWLGRVADLLHARFRDTLSLDEVARTAGVHPAHLARAFRRCYSCTVGEYVRRLRVDQAGCELSRSDAPLTQIALALGFCDHSHFSTVFKRHTGLSPAEYRKLFRRC